MSSDRYRLHELLTQLYEERKTGALTCQVKGYEKKLFLKDGIACFAVSADPEDKLPNVLMAQGRFTEEQFAGAEPNFNDSLSVGRNLVEMGLITQQELVQGAREQVYSIFQSCMCEEAGQGSFDEGGLPGGIVSLPLPYPQSIFRAVMAMEDKDWISSQFGTALSFIPVPEPGKKLKAETLGLGDFAAPLYAMIDGEANFNHLAFEAEVDDFQLLKFLYALKLLKYVHIARDEDEPEPEVDDVIDDLNMVMEQREELERLRDPDLKLGMDETISISREKAAQMGGSMDVTMEISREALKGDMPLGDDTGEVPRPDGLDDDAEEEDPFEAETAASFEAAFAEAEALDAEAEEDEEEEAGLDDLDAASEDVFAEEMARMEAPLTRHIPEGVIMPDDEDEEDEAPPPAAERGNRKPLYYALALIALGALMFLVRPYVEKTFNPLGPDPNPPVSEADLALIDAPPTPAQGAPPPDDAAPDAAASAPDEAEPVPDDAVGSSAETDLAPSREPAAADPPAVVAETAPAEADPTNDAAPQAAATEKTVPAAEVPADRTTATTTPREPDAPAHGAEAADEPVFRSPVAEGWDPETRRPRGRLQASVDLPPVVAEPVADPLPTDTETAPPTPRRQPREVPRTEAVKTAPTPEKTAPPQAPAPEVSASRDTPDRARAQLAAGDYAAAARTWQAAMQGDAPAYTLAVFLACDPATITSALAAVGTPPELFVLPVSRNGRPCYWVCWGGYKSRIEAVGARKTVPRDLAAQTEIETYPLARLLR